MIQVSSLFHVQSHNLLASKREQTTKIRYNMSGAQVKNSCALICVALEEKLLRHSGLTGICIVHSMIVATQ